MWHKLSRLVQLFLVSPGGRMQILIRLTIDKEGKLIPHTYVCINACLNLPQRHNLAYHVMILEHVL